MSLGDSVDAVINQVPVLTHRNNIAFKVSIDNIHNINKTPKHPRRSRTLN